MTVIHEKFILEIIVIFSSLIPKAVKRNMTRQEFYCDYLDLARRFQVQSFPKILPMMLMLYGLILCGGQMWHQVRLSQIVTKLFHYSFHPAQFVKEVSSRSCRTLNPFITRALTASSSRVTMLNQNLMLNIESNHQSKPLSFTDKETQESQVTLTQEQHPGLLAGLIVETLSTLSVLFLRSCLFHFVLVPGRFLFTLGRQCSPQENQQILIACSMASTVLDASEEEGNKRRLIQRSESLRVQQNYVL